MMVASPDSLADGEIMVRTQIIIAIASLGCAVCCAPGSAIAQQLYAGTTAAELEWAGNTGIDKNGRAINVDGRTDDRYGTSVDDYAWPPAASRYPRSTAGGFYSPGNYTGTFYTGGASRYPNPNRSGAATYNISPPRSIVVGGVYPSRTIMNNGTRGTVIEYTHNGNGSISTPGSTYQTVISSGPSIFPSISVVSPSQPPVVIETQPTQVIGKRFAGTAATKSAVADNTNYIRLMCPKEAIAPLSFLLNGTIYSIKPGYTQSIPADRPWTIEFVRNGSGSARVRYDLRAGNYVFVSDAHGWDLMPYPSAAQPEIPPSPVPCEPIPSDPPQSVPPLLTEPVPVPAPAPGLPTGR
jgi:hypothetical protein